jgi:hypothetical protein
MRTEYSTRVKTRIWSTAAEIYQNAARNAFEFASEGYVFFSLFCARLPCEPPRNPPRRLTGFSRVRLRFCAACFALLERKKQLGLAEGRRGREHVRVRRDGGAHPPVPLRKFASLVSCQRERSSTARRDQSKAAFTPSHFFTPIHLSLLARIARYYERTFRPTHMHTPVIQHSIDWLFCTVERYIPIDSCTVFPFLCISPSTYAPDFCVYHRV